MSKYETLYQSLFVVVVFPSIVASIFDVDSPLSSAADATSTFSKSSGVVSSDDIQQRLRAKNADMMNPLFWSQYLTPHHKEYMHPEKRVSIAAKSCKPVLTAISTYTHGRGIQYPTVVFTPRCQGGIKNPENYQCQPSLMVIECFHFQNELGDDDFLGLYSHGACQERCVCGRKSCKSKQIHTLICPPGFREDKKTCQCVSVVGQTIFYRSLGMIADWDKNLHRICRTNSVHHATKVGESFKLKVI